MSFTRQGDFVRVVKRYPGAKAGDPVTVSMTTDNHVGHKEKKDPSFRIAIRIRPEVMHELGWKMDTFLEFHEGTNRNGGKLLLIPTNDKTVGFKLSNVSIRMAKDKAKHINPDESAGGVNVGASAFLYHDLPNERQLARGVKYQILNNELLITMPDWFKPAAQTDMAIEADEPVAYEQPMPQRRGRAAAVYSPTPKRKARNA